MAKAPRALRFAVSGALIAGASASCTSRGTSEEGNKPSATTEPPELRHTVNEGPQDEPTPEDPVPPTTAIVEDDVPPLPLEPQPDPQPDPKPVKESPVKAPEKDPEPKHVNFGPPKPGKEKS